MIIKGILVFAEAVGLATFLLTIMMGLPCIGNIAGTAFFGALLSATLFFDKTKQLVSAICRTPAGKTAFLLLCAAVAAGLVWCAVLSVKMAKAASNYPKEPDKCRTLIVLGCKVNKDGPSRMLKRRLDAAAEYLLKQPSAICVVSGGKGADEPTSEAKAMCDYLTAVGVEKDRIILEDKSESTEENIIFSLKKLDELGIGHDETAIVTDGYHQLRAGMIAKKHGLSPKAISADTETSLLPTYWVREWFAITKEMIFG